MYWFMSGEEVSMDEGEEDGWVVRSMGYNIVAGCGGEV